MFTEAFRLARYNWPLYVFAALTIAGGVAAAFLFAHPLVRGAAIAAVAVASWFSCASFLAFHLMFDRSGLIQWEWLRAELSPPPARWVHLSAGLELTRAPMSALFPGSTGVELDLYDPETMPAPAVGRARADRAEATTALPAKLPVEAASADTILVVLAAHEIRSRATREALFSELARVLAPGGRLILIEHFRDLAAALAFGPGCLHFFPRSEWLDLTSRAGLRVERERSFSPWVRVFVCQRGT